MNTKNLFFSIVICLLVIVPVVSQETSANQKGAISTSKADLDALRELNKQVVAEFEAKKYDRALAAAQQDLALRIKIFGADDKSLANTFRNIGLIYHEKREYKKAVENFEKAAAIYQKFPPQKSLTIPDLSLEIATTYFAKGDKKSAAEWMQKGLIAAETNYGANSKEILQYIQRLATLYYLNRENDAADELLRRAVDISKETLSSDRVERTQVNRNYLCFIHQAYDLRTAAEKAEIVKDQNNSSVSNIVNGKAVSLVKPEYPSQARANRTTGVVLVEIEINEQGSVEKVEAYCGPEALRAASAEAARKSRFSSTFRDAVPVKAVGTIVYNFTP